MPSDPKNKQLQVTSPDSWNTGKVASPDTQMLELPSGNVVEARRTMSLLRLVQEGQIPNPLRGIVMRMVTSGSMEMPKDAQTDMRLMSQFAEFLDSIAIDTVVTPRISRPAPRGKVKNEAGNFVNPQETEDEYYERLQDWTPDEGTLSVFLMDANDKMFLFIFAQGGAADAKEFREEQAKSLESVSAVKKRPKPTKRTGGSGSRGSK